jgi:glucokinase
LNVFLGIDAGGTNVKIAVVGTTGKVYTRGVIDTNPSEGPRKTFRRARTAADTLTRFRKDINVVGVGVGCAGLIDPVKGRVFSPPNLPGWENSPLKRIVETTFGVYTIVDNDANSAAYGEFRLGACRGVQNLVFITLGTGVGGGVVADGRLLRGASNYAAELGHTAVTVDGPKCRCGARGCLEAYVGAYGLIRSAREQLRAKNSRVLRRWVERDKRRLTPQLIFDAARRRDAAASAVIRAAGEHLGVGIASLINIFNPEAVVLGGGVSGSFDLLRPHIERTVGRRAFAESARVVDIVRSELGNDAAVLGAAMLAKDALELRNGGRKRLSHKRTTPNRRAKLDK